jgi:hypothetical protein
VFRINRSNNSENSVTVALIRKYVTILYDAEKCENHTSRTLTRGMLVLDLSQQSQYYSTATLNEKGPLERRTRTKRQWVSSHNVKFLQVSITLGSNKSYFMIHVYVGREPTWQENSVHFRLLFPCRSHYVLHKECSNAHNITLNKIHVKYQMHATWQSVGVAFISKGKQKVTHAGLSAAVTWV